ncbi:MAG: alpha/beta fold hydrolase [Burkholderiaceae bacterium]
MTNPIYYLPGANGQLHSGLGQALVERGFAPQGRATVGAFKRLSFDEQVSIVADDLQQPLWWAETARIITNSYGSYLFLHAQLLMPAHPASILMLSPILGAFENGATGQAFVPPYADRLFATAQRGTFPTPPRLIIHTGSEDWQSPPASAVAFGELTGAAVHVAHGRGHMLGKDYVGPLLDGWLRNSPTRSDSVLASTQHDLLR